MGGSDKAGSKKSEIMGKNLDQMINVLHARLKSLEDCANTRIRLCKDDLNPISKNMSKQVMHIIIESENAQRTIIIHLFILFMFFAGENFIE